MEQNRVLRVVWTATYWVCLTYPGIAVAQQNKDLPRATVNLTVRAPGGRPLANTEINVRSGEHFFREEERPSASVKADAQGHVSFSWPVGLQRLCVRVKGIGYGSTGRFELLEGNEARPALPPLVPYGAVEGSVSKDSLKPGVYVEVSSMNHETARKCECDAAGRFVFEDLPAGEYHLMLQPSSRRIRNVTGAEIMPGQRLRGVIVQKEKDETESREEAMMFGMHSSQANETLWAAGVVHDETGRPVEGVDVFAVIDFYGGIRMYERITAVKTDKDGRWRFRGSDSLSAFSGTIIASKAGHPYTHATMLSPIPGEVEDDAKKPDLSNYDLVLPARGGSLEVTVLRDGKPLEQAAVKIARHHGPHIYSEGYVGGDRSSHRPVVEQLLTPHANTNAEGIARFTDLVPGEYELTAFAGNANEMYIVDSAFHSENKKAFVQINSVTVEVGNTKKCRVSVLPPPQYQLPIKVLRPDGRPFPEKEMQASGTADAFGERGAAEKPRADGASLHSFYGTGLHPVTFTVADPRAHHERIDEPPCEQAVALVAVSPLLPEEPVMVLTSAHRQLGSLVVQVRDKVGRPLRASVLVDRSPFSEIPNFAATTDAQGEVRLEDVTPGEHTVEAFPAGQTYLDAGDNDGPFLDDKNLAGRTLIASQKATTPAGVETRLTMRAVPAGYVRGRLRLPSGKTPETYYVHHDEWNVLGFHHRYNPKTGEFLFGPLPEGKTTVYVLSSEVKRSHGVVLRQDVTLRSDRVIQCEIVVPRESEQHKPGHDPQQAFMGMGGISMLGEGAPGSRGHVFLSDGKTAAYAAVLAYFVPDTVSPVGMGEADACGRISVGGAWYSGEGQERKLPGSPTEPVLVTWLPGTCGATITPLGDGSEMKSLKIILPPPLTVSGKVTVAGKAPDGRQRKIQVVALYQGKGKLSGVLSRSVATEPDGSFQLPALTPGTYRVQAALDDLWLSPSTLLKVGDNAAELKPMALDFPPPGPGTIVKVVDRAGRPLADVHATVTRPEGPLADSLSQDLTSDGAGMLHIPPVESGGAHHSRPRGEGSSDQRAAACPRQRRRD